MDREIVEEVEPDPPDNPLPNQEEQHLDHHLSLNVMKGANGVGTIKFIGQINDIQVQILVDGGGSKNFLQPRVANFIKLPIQPSLLFQVLVGNGNSMAAEGMVPNLTVIVQGHELSLPLLLFNA